MVCVLSLVCWNVVPDTWPDFGFEGCQNGELTQWRGVLEQLFLSSCTWAQTKTSAGVYLASPAFHTGAVSLYPASLLERICLGITAVLLYRLETF